MIIRILIFLAINFTALALGGIFTNQGVASEWYHELNKAPWTPPGWVFGAAWSTIMICLSFFMADAWGSAKNRKALTLFFAFQWILNISWNPVFFYFHHSLLGMMIITTLTATIAVMTMYYFPKTKQKTLLILPYLIWLILATSLNGYILLKN